MIWLHLELFCGKLHLSDLIVLMIYYINRAILIDFPPLILIQFLTTSM